MINKLTIEEIAQYLGTSTTILLEQYGCEEEVIDKFTRGEIKILND